jgi:hypothetical protein
MNKKEIRHAFNVLITHAENAKCVDLHPPKKWTHSHDELCPAAYNIHKQANILRDYMKVNDLQRLIKRIETRWEPTVESPSVTTC